MWVFRPPEEEITAQRVCRSCNAPIVWAITLNGSKAPLNADFTQLESRKFKIQSGAEVEIIAVPNKSSHFATCPQAQQFSKRRK